MTKVQKVYEACMAAFTSIGAAPSPQAFQHLKSVLDSIKPADVGLEDEALGRPDRISEISLQNGQQSRSTPHRKPPITYLCLHECDKFSIAIFCLSPSAVIPLHNHPDMIVLSKIIYGSMHIRAYDWLDPYDEDLNADPSIPRPARLAINQTFSAPCEPSVLYPTTGGNIHSFTAVTSCAVLDVLAPPYSPPYSTERPCTYFRQIPRNEFSEEADGYDEDVALLEESQLPVDFVVPRVVYKGPNVVL